MSTISPAETLQAAEALSPDTATPPSTSPPASSRAVVAVDPVLGAVDTLTPEEQVEYMACEAIIQEGSCTFVQVGQALARIRDKQLYRAGFDSFQAYYQAKWDFEHSHVYCLIAAAELFGRLAAVPNLPKPDHVSQLRPLLGLAPEAAEAVWEHAASLSNGRKITARLVKRAVKALRKPAGRGAQEKLPARAERAAQREAIAGVIGELLMLISQRANYELLLGKVQALSAHLERLFALERKRSRPAERQDG